MGWVNDKLEREASRPHWYVVFCDGVEVGSAPSPDDACRVARKHSKAPKLEWTRKTRLWFAVVGDRLYEIRKLVEARPAADYIRRDRRHG